MQALKNKNISFIGGGNMAQAMISGLLAKGIAPKQITVSDPDINKLDSLQQKGLKTIDPAENPIAAVTEADVVILAVKPQVMREVLAQFKDGLDNQLIVSIAAGLSINSLASMMDGYHKIVRAMPNTPAMIQMGASGLYAPENITDEQKQIAQALLSSAGLALWVETEDHLHAVTAVSGSAPAYFFYMIENMVEAATKMGLDKKQASALAMQTAMGAAQMCIVSDDEPNVLRQKVTSPNGTTHEAIESMKANKVGENIQQAMQACVNRSQELSKQLA